MPRSGTTLLSSRLSAHSRIAIAPESHYLNVWVPEHRHLDLARPTDFRAFWSAFSTSDRFSYFGVSPEDVRRRIRDTRRSDHATIFRCLLEAYAERQGKNRWGEKTPAHFEHVDELLGWFPGARIVFMVRDPRAVVSSLQRVPWAGSGVARHAVRWQRAADEASRRSADERVRIVRYEDLVTDPEATLRTVCDLVGESYEPGMLQASEATSPIVNRSGWAQEHLSSALSPVTSGHARKWETQLAPNDVAVIETLTDRGMRRYGYDRTRPDVGPGTLRVLRSAEWLAAVPRAPRRVLRTARTELRRPRMIRLRANIARLPRRGLKTARLAARTFVGDRRSRSFPRPADYVRPQRTLGYVGWLGHRNAGDEALYDAIDRLFGDVALLSYNDAAPIELLAHAAFVKRGRVFDGVMLGGGTLINDPGYRRWMRLAQGTGLPTVVFGSGVRDPEFWEAYPETGSGRDGLAGWTEVLRACRFVGVRGPRSARLLEGLGITDVRVVGDPALSMAQPPPEPPPRYDRIAVNLGSTGPIFGSQASVLQAVAEAVRHLLDAGTAVEYVAMHRVDVALGERLQRELDVELPVWRADAAATDLVAGFARFDGVIAQRLHAVVIPHALAIPVVALGYRPKHEDYMAGMDALDALIRTDEVTGERLLATWSGIDANREAWRTRLTEAGDRYRATQASASREIIDGLWPSGDRTEP